METAFILTLTTLTIVCCFGYWYCVLHPAEKPLPAFSDEYWILELMQAVSVWEHEQSCR